MKIVFSNEDDSDKKSPGFLKTVFGASGLVTVWVFVTGWAYLYTFYEYFGVNINSLGFPTYHFFIFSFTQFVTFRWKGVLIGLILIAVFILTWLGSALQVKRWAIFISVLYLVLLWGCFKIAVTDGASAAIQEMGIESTLPLISLEFKDPNRQFKYGMIEQTLESPYLHLLLANGNRLFVFVPVDNTKPEVSVQVVEVDKADFIATIRTVRVKTQ